MAAYPSKRSVSRFRDKLRRMTSNNMTWKDAGEIVGDVNRVARGWVNYFRYGTLWKTYGNLERFLQHRLCGWLAHKHKVRTSGERRYPATYIYGELGLFNLTQVLKPSRTPCR
jgi:hypothetical protein